MNLKLELSVNEINVIMAALGKMPLETVVDVWAKIRGQCEPQIAAQQVEVEPPKEE